jgi:hypothetical protein
MVCYVQTTQTGHATGIQKTVQQLRQEMKPWRLAGPAFRSRQGPELPPAPRTDPSKQYDRTRLLS